jgi:putative restriction endonuclease
MATPLGKQDLLSKLLGAIASNGYQAIVADRTHPFLLRVFKQGEQTYTNLRVYIWNCTHGGKNRADDEYRVQLTSVVPEEHEGERTLLLGWHDGFGVFVGFDISKHAGQDSASPSIQVKEDILLNAHKRAFAAYERANGEIAIAFRPEFIVDYALSVDRLHGQKGVVQDFIKLLNQVDSLSDAQIEEVKGKERKEVVATIKRKYREADFRFRVLTTYRNRCAMCGLQLGLVEAAHILPVAADGSTDETSNGVALCSLHHDAFDASLVSFDERYKVEVSQAALVDLDLKRLLGGRKKFTDNLKPGILLPADQRDYPNPRYIRKGKMVRLWRP